MTQATLSNDLYTHTLSVLNRALPLEYAIRAMKVAEPAIFSGLEALDKDIESYWLSHGWEKASIDDCDLKDLSWDTLQCNYLMVRNHARLFSHPKEMRLGLQEISDRYHLRFNELECDFLYRFRACDLLSGNDVLKLLSTTKRSLEDSKKATHDDKLLAESFLRKVREAQYLFPNAVLSTGTMLTKRGGEQDARWLGVPYDLSLEELRGALNEFLYQYARERLLVETGGVPSSIINAVLAYELREQPLSAHVKTFRGLYGPLRGLLCWDLNHKYKSEKIKGFRDRATSEAASLCADYMPDSRNKGDQDAKTVLLEDLKGTKTRINDVRPALSELLEASRNSTIPG